MHSYHRPRRIQYVLGLSFVAFGGLVNAQGPVSNVLPCTSKLTPQPCPLLASEMASCAADDGDSFVLLNVLSEPLGMYPAPAANTTALEKCQCTEVAYNLYAACAACQFNDDSTHWSNHDTWFSGCTENSDQTQIAVSPPKMSNEDITSWMTHKYTPTFSLAEALAIPSGGPLPSITATSSTDSLASAASSNLANTTNASSSPSSSNTTPIIIGAVVGAVGLLALIALIFFCIRRRQKQRTAPSAEFMKYSQVNAGTVREPFRSHSRANTAEEEMHQAQGGYQGGGYQRHSAIRLDSVGSGEEAGGIEMTEGGTNPPPFTPGLFKDPIFEKGVALNLAAASGAGPGAYGGSGVSGTYGSSPVTYSPATPSTLAHNAAQYSERHGLIHGRQETL